MSLVTAFIVAVILGVAEGLFGAQLIVWGLAQFHIHSGIVGPWFILVALTMLFSGTARAVKS